jgi:hypothetical protein
MDPDLAAEIAELSRQHDQLMARDREPIASPYVRKEGRDAALMFRTQENARALAAAAEPPIEGEIYTDEATGIVYRLHDRVAQNEKNSADWNRWLDDRLAPIIKEVDEAFGSAVRRIEYVEDTFCRKIASLEGELAECKGMLGRALTALDDARKAAAANDAEQRADIEGLKRRDLERHVRDRTIAERSARISELQRENSASHADLARQQRDQELAQRDQRIEMLEIKLGMLLNWIGQDLPRRFFERTE